MFSIRMKEPVGFLTTERELQLLAFDSQHTDWPHAPGCLSHMRGF